MGFSTVLIISLAAGAVLVLGGGVMMYLGSLVRSAYEIKVQITNDVDSRLNKMAEELDKKSRWIKRDLLEEIEKIKVALHTDSARKVAELSDPLLKRVEAVEARLASVHAELAKAIEDDRQALSGLDARVKMVMKQTAPRREIEKPEEPAPSAGASGALDEAAAILAARAAAGTSAAAAAATDGAAPATPPPPPGPVSVKDLLPDLG